MSLYDDVEREARHDWLNTRDTLSTGDVLAECGYDDCTGDCTRRVVACGPCAWCGDPTEPGESLCRTCQREEEAERA